MLPLSLRETSEEAAKRQANFICLRFLEDKVPKTLFEEVVKTVIDILSLFLQVSDKLELPQRIDWKGDSRPLNFEEVKLNFSQIDQNFITKILQNQTEGVAKQVSKKDASLNVRIQYQPKFPAIRESKQYLVMPKLRRASKLQFIVYFLTRLVTSSQVELMMGKYSFITFYRIIKIWDKETMNLQGSLHSHNEVITDMDISKCNRYLATSSKDGKLIIWDWKNCLKVDEIAAHDSTINNIKFFQVKIKNQNQQTKESEKIQILATCSEDGTIKIYDELGFLNNLNQGVIEQAQKRTRRNDSAANKKERYFQCLTPDDFRPVQGNRNKKIDSININQNGLVAAGTSSGEIYMWKLDIVKFRQQHQKAFQWLGSSKKHIKTVHFCEFSPNGRFLFTGSVDGTAKIWNIEQEKGKKITDQQLLLTDSRLLVTMEEKRIFGSKDKHIFFQNRHGDQVSMAEYRQQKSNWQCDCIAWSVHGRYAICALSGKIDLDNQSHDQSFIKIWDSYTNTIIEDIGEKNGLKLMNFSFVLAPHPTIEEVFLSGSDGGLICLWDIKQRRLIKSFKEYGVYTYEKYTMNDPFDGKFSPDGSCFVIGSEMGTISLFSCEGAPYKYYATRVEQFYHYDDQRHIANIYYDQNEEPQICSYNLIPYEAQPPSSMIGKFKNFRHLNHEEYDRNFILRQGICIEEEQFIQSQIEEGLRNNFFNNNEDLLQMINGQYEDDQILRGRLNSQLSNISAADNVQQASQDDIEILRNVNRQAQQNRGRGRRRNQVEGRSQRPINNQQRYEIQNQLNARINTNIDPDNSFYDRDSDENFEIEEDVQSEEEEEYGNEDSEDYHTRNERDNNHQRILTRRELQAAANNRSGGRNLQRMNGHQNQQQSRSQRLQRRNQRMNQLEEDKDDVNQNQGRSKRRRRAVVKSDDSSQCDISEDEDYDMSDDNDAIKPRRKLKKIIREESQQNESMSDITNYEESDDEINVGVRTRNARKGSKNPKQSEQEKREIKRNLRSRENRKKCDGMDSSEDDFMDYEEEKLLKNNSDGQKPGSQGKKSKRVIKEDSDSDNIDQEVIIPTDLGKKQKGDEDYEYQPNHPINQIQLQEQMIQQRKCELCKRTDPPIIGPFLKVNKYKQNEHPIFFHKDCIEVSSVSFFNRQKQKWMNIGKALDIFNKRPSMCRRCQTIGATIKCQSCDKTYHGFLCSQLYMIFTGAENYQCFECRNRENYSQFNGKELIEKSEFKILKRQMKRDYLLLSKQPIEFYLPQVNDQVYYFFQGHEKFISQYNCFFYSGNEKTLTVQYPWKQYLELEKPTLCKILRISYFFPSKNVLYLLKRYGKSSNIIQEPQIVMRLELQIVGQPDSTFDIDYFPNQLSEFLVLKRLYENSLFLYHGLMNQQKFIGETFKTRLKNFNKVKIVGIQEKEQLLDPTGWESIQYKHVDNYSLRERGRRGQRRQSFDEEPAENMNFWELILSLEFEENLDYQGLVSSFNDEEIQSIISIISEYVERKKEQTLPFMERVPEKIAPDYRQHVSAEMYISLVLERLLNKYYRTQEQLFNDLELISFNARIYNGEDNPLFKDAKKMVEGIKSEIRKSIILHSEDTKQQKIEEQKGLLFGQKPIGKLTAPVMRNNGGSNQLTTMDQFKMQMKQQEKDEELKNDNSNNNSYNNHVLIQQLPQSRSSRRNRENNADNMQMIQSSINQIPAIQNNLIEIKQQEMSDHSDMKVTPNAKITINAGAQNHDSSGSNRRLNRNQIGDQRDFELDYENKQNNQFATGEKIILKTNYANDGSDNLGSLGKRTRSGRQTRQVKNSLNEDEGDKEFEKLISGEQINSKRIRQN
ncbi:UNKNOWN [Stylonychia lemnae]|uniref:Bromo domain-containing protein n=1 Tax=Stylonychia lemnae TaxID=5949 RepID=A0A078A359_STYLE|nr:UNKNOWN [Stylonychia lemnae]|eukprot:CDW76602.1 UNKNOWN [Stylonychia lemnae]